MCYLAPWVDYGGSDKGTIDWFRWLDRDRYAPLLVTTQPSDNRRLAEVYPYAEEVWALPELLAGQHMPTCIFDLIHTRGVRVLHIMNSRMGFDLLPDLASLPSPPVIVVQLHVEEPDRSGYVRYVTTRYGNLVDGFSVSSRHLARTLEHDYHVSADRIHVIPTGVDAEQEFNPARVTPIDGLRPDRFNILYPGRLAEQKDPLLMVEVIARVLEKHRSLHVHVVGEGPLEPEVRERVRDAGIEEHFSFHPPSRELARWYAACDLLLMTSVFEGVPYVVYEAMAMALPIVAPALVGNVELMGDTAGVLVDSRDDVAAYAGAIDSLITDAARRKRLAEAGRSRVVEEFSLQAMGEKHGQLCDELLLKAEAKCAQRAAPAANRARPASSGRTSQRATSDTGPLRFATRPTGGEPKVSVVVPCFNHGSFLHECVRSILEQDYEDIELLIVDDASTDLATLRVLEELEAHERIEVIRQSRNSGPSAARNRAIAQAKGRYVLPVDSDNMLLPGAVKVLVEQLQSAGETVGYVYPNCQYFGTRDDYFQPPSFNLALLLQGNFCDTCSLIDREVFDAGLRYAEDIELGHEDWDFVLTLAARGVRGVPAARPTLLYRKHGFTRSDAVEYAGRSFHEEIVARHPELFGDADSVGRFGRWTGPAAEIKARHAPGLSVIMTAPIDFSSEIGSRLINGLWTQSCRDIELIAECPIPPDPATGCAVLVRRIPPGLCSGPVERLGEGLAMTRANHTLVADGELVEMLAEPAFVERLMRTFWAIPALEAVAFVDAGQHGRFPYRLLDEADIDRGCAAHAIAWREEAKEKIADALLVSDQSPAESIARSMSARGVRLQWRHAPSYGEVRETEQGKQWLHLGSRQASLDPHRQTERRMLARTGPTLPALPYDQVRRWLGAISWMPPETELLTRHREAAGARRIVTLGRDSPEGYVLEYDLGAIQRFAPPGTVRLVQDEQGTIRTMPRGSPRQDGETEFGHLEMAPLPLLQGVSRVVLADGSHTLVSGERDGLRAGAVESEFLGFIESFPNNPPLPPERKRPSHGIVGLQRRLDMDARRHVYAAGEGGRGELVGELGALHLTAEPGSLAVWIGEDGLLLSEGCPLAMASPDLRARLHWVAAPLAWRGFGRMRGRMRATARRLRDELAKAFGGLDASANGIVTCSEPSAMGEPAGYLYSEDGPGRVALYVALHPTTGDQLATHHPLEAADMGYGDVKKLGYIIGQAPATGTLAMRRMSVPWASRFGLEVRYS